MHNDEQLTLTSVHSTHSTQEIVIRDSRTAIELNARYQAATEVEERGRMRELIQRANKRRADAYAAADATAIIEHQEAIRTTTGIFRANHTRMLDVILRDMRKRAEGYANADELEHSGRARAEGSREEADKQYTIAVWDRQHFTTSQTYN